MVRLLEQVSNRKTESRETDLADSGDGRAGRRSMREQAMIDAWHVYQPISAGYGLARPDFEIWNGTVGCSARYRGEPLLMGVSHTLSGRSCRQRGMSMRYDVQGSGIPLSGNSHQSRNRISGRRILLGNGWKVR